MSSRNLLNGTVGVLGALVALGGAGCGELPEEGTSDPNGTLSAEVERVASALTTTYGGTQYASQCLSAGVPLPPPWGQSTTQIYGAWTYTGSYSDTFFGIDGGKIWYHTETNPPGLCIINAHYEGGLFDVICQGTNGKACFWEGVTPTSDASPPATAMVIASTTQNGSIPGGAAIASHQPCGQCHAGENAFIGHYQPNHPLNLTSLNQWMPTAWSEPFVAAKWPQNDGPQTTGISATCTACHTTPTQPATPTIGGRFPLLNRAQLTGNYCSLMETLTNLPSSQGGMPPNQECTPDVNCARQTDPGVRAMLETCGTASGPPTSISGFGAPYGIGAQAMAKRFHVSPSGKGMHQHYFTGATTTMPNPGCCTNQNNHPQLLSDDTINAWVYLPPDDVPREVMLQIFDGTTWYRAYWGEDMMTTYGPRTRIGNLPASGGWQVLAFRPANLGLFNGLILKGMAFTLYDGSAAWADVLFRQGGSTYQNVYVSQVWVGNEVPAGATTGADNEPTGWIWKPENVAQFYGTAYTSSTYGGGNGAADARKGLDGNPDGNWSHGSVFHTNNTYDTTYFGLGTGGEYWYVDLRGIRTVRGVIVHNRTDCCMDRLSHFRIATWNGSRWVLASDQSSTLTSAANPIIDIPFGTPVNTQYVMVQKADHNYLHLAEVQVYGDP